MNLIKTLAIGAGLVSVTLFSPAAQADRVCKKRCADGICKERCIETDARGYRGHHRGYDRDRGPSLRLRIGPRGGHRHDID